MRAPEYAAPDRVLLHISDTHLRAPGSRLFDRLDAVEEARRLELDPAVFAALEAALDAVASIAGVGYATTAYRGLAPYQVLTPPR